MKVNTNEIENCCVRCVRNIICNRITISILVVLVVIGLISVTTNAASSDGCTVLKGHLVELSDHTVRGLQPTPVEDSLQMLPAHVSLSKDLSLESGHLDVAENMLVNRLRFVGERSVKSDVTLLNGVTMLDYVTGLSYVAPLDNVTGLDGVALLNTVARFNGVTLFDDVALSNGVDLLDDVALLDSFELFDGVTLLDGVTMLDSVTMVDGVVTKFVLA